MRLLVVVLQLQVVRSCLVLDMFRQCMTCACSNSENEQDWQVALDLTHAALEDSPLRNTIYDRFASHLTCKAALKQSLNTVYLFI